MTIPRVNLQQYAIKRESIAADAIAGLTFAVVNVPQGMANALLAGVNPVFGLYTLMVGTPVAALFTSSVFMNVSTTSALSVATGDALAGVPASLKPANLVTLVLLVGIVQVLAGLLRMGTLLRFVARSVMVGFVAGVAALIILGQVEDFTGYDSIFGNKILRVADLILNLGQVHWPTLLLSSTTVLVILGLGFTPLRKIAMLLGLVFCTAVAYVLQPEGIAYVGDIATFPSQLLDVDLPDLFLAPDLVTSAIAIAIVGLVQGAAISQSYPNPDGTYPDASRDFLGQGMANLATSVFHGIPAGGSMSGTAVTVGAGGQTRWANILAGLFIIPIVWLLEGVINRVPMPGLAALLVVVGFQSIKVEEIRTVWQTGRISAVAMGLTFAATLLLPLQFAVFVGVAVSILLYVARSSNQVTVVEWVMVQDGFPLEQDVPGALKDEEITVLYTYGSLFFAAASNAESQFPEVGDAKRPVVILAVRGHEEVGSTLVGIVVRYAQAIQANGGRLMLVGVSPHVYKQLRRSRGLQAIGEENVFLAEPQVGLALNKALEEARAWLASGAETGSRTPEEASG